MNAILGNTKPDLIGQLLGTGYQCFDSPFGIHGLCKESQLRLDLLAVYAKHQGKGEFRKFIEVCKRNYLSIYVWEISNPIVSDCLQRYHFKPVSQTEPDGEVLTGMMWPP